MFLLSNSTEQSQTKPEAEASRCSSPRGWGADSPTSRIPACGLSQKELSSLQFRFAFWVRVLSQMGSCPREPHPAEGACYSRLPASSCPSFAHNCQAFCHLCQLPPSRPSQSRPLCNPTRTSNSSALGTFSGPHELPSLARCSSCSQRLQELGYPKTTPCGQDPQKSCRLMGPLKRNLLCSMRSDACQRGASASH